MPATAPPARIGKTTGTRPRPANSEKLTRGAKFHAASEIEAGSLVMAKKTKAKRRGKPASGLINRVGT